MKRVKLNGIWDVKGISPEGEEIQLTGNVPGCALNDVLNFSNNNISNVFWRDNAEKVQIYENYHWVYSKVFRVEEILDCAVLVFERLDTYADVYLNGKHLGYFENGNISHEIDVHKYLVIGENRIEVYLYSPIERVRGKKVRSGAFTKERMNTRRTQCTYGWDWTMRFVTCGIADVYIKMFEKQMQVKTAYVYTLAIDSESAQIGIDTEFLYSQQGGFLKYEIYDEQGSCVFQKERYCEENFTRMIVDISDPQLWYPLGYGKHPLYELQIKADQELLWKTKFGIRIARITEIKDAPGSENHQKCLDLKKSAFAEEYDLNEEFSGFILSVNGTKIMCKGADWVPCEPFNHGETEKKIKEILQLAADAGVNMIRVWGGGRFESEFFYDECSRLGIMVTQDFLMACGEYPEEETWFLEQLRIEAEYATDLLRNKACLMWWSGDNENAVDGSDQDRNYRGRKSAYKAIAPVIYQKDPYRRFLASSPYGGKKYASNTVGTTHNSQFLSYFFKDVEQKDFSDYKEYFKDYNARFIVEEPCLGAGNFSSLKKIMTEEDIFGENCEMWKYHSKTNPGLRRELFDYMSIFAEKVLGKFENAQDRYFKLKYIQYEWIRISMERSRRTKWFCAGILYWMLNDCWPAASGWSMIDYYNIPKASWYAFKKTAKPVILSIDHEDQKYNFYLCTDGKKKEVDFSWFIINDEGKMEFGSSKRRVLSEENETICIESIDDDAYDLERKFILAEIKDGEKVIDRTFYRNGKLELEERPGELEILSFEKNAVTIKALNYIHVVELEAAAVFEDNYFSMISGEIRKIKYEMKEEGKIKVKGYSFKN